MLKNGKEADSGVGSGRASVEEIMSDETQINDDELWRWTDAAPQSPPSESFLRQPESIKHKSTPQKNSITHSESFRKKSTPRKNISGSHNTANSESCKKKTSANITYPNNVHLQNYPNYKGVVRNCHVVEETPLNETILAQNISAENSSRKITEQNSKPTQISEKYCYQVRSSSDSLKQQFCNESNQLSNPETRDFIETDHSQFTLGNNHFTKPNQSQTFGTNAINHFTQVDQSLIFDTQATNDFTNLNQTQSLGVQTDNHLTSVNQSQILGTEKTNDFSQIPETQATNRFMNLETQAVKNLTNVDQTQIFGSQLPYTSIDLRQPNIHSSLPYSVQSHQHTLSNANNYAAYINPGHKNVFSSAQNLQRTDAIHNLANINLCHPNKSSSLAVQNQAFTNQDVTKLNPYETVPESSQFSAAKLTRFDSQQVLRSNLAQPSSQNPTQFHPYIWAPPSHVQNLLYTNVPPDSSTLFPFDNQGEHFSQVKLRSQANVEKGPQKRTLANRRAEESEEAINHLSTQTPVIWPLEETQLTLNILQHVTVIRSILGIKQFEIENPYHVADISQVFGKKKSHEINSPDKRTKKSKMASGQVQDQPEVIDLTSSPEESALIKSGKTAQKEALEKQNVPVGTERLRYTFRHSSGTEGVVRCLEAVAEYISQEVVMRAAHLTFYWTGSLLELCVDTVIRSAHAEDTRAAPTAARLACRLTTALAQHNHLNAEDHLESISNVILKLSECNSVALDLVDHMLVLLPRLLEEIFGESGRIATTIHLLENLYHVLRILATVLGRLNNHLHTSGLLKTNKSTQDENIMNLWRKHWRPAGGPSGSSKPSHPSPMLTRFVHKLELLLTFSLTRAPLLSPLLTECLHSAQLMHFSQFQLWSHSTQVP